MLQKIFPQITPFASHIILISACAFIANLILSSSGTFQMADIFGLYYFGIPKFKPFQLVTAIFLQTSIMTFVFQAFSFSYIGSFMEHIWGSDKFLKFFVASALISTLTPQIIYAGFIYYQYHTLTLTTDILNVISDNPFTMTVALGGVIMSFFGAITMFNPNQDVQFMFIPVNIKAKYLFWGIVAFHTFSAIYYFNLFDLSSAIFAVCGYAGVLMTHFFFNTGIRRF
jgi:membrane associated rhomboid family serine protease